MDWLRSLLESQPLLTLFLVISLGYAVGEVAIAGFRLGVGAVLFVGLAIGAFAPDVAPPGILGTVGLVLFFYGIGIQYGKPFIEGLSSRASQRQNAIAILSTLGAGIVAALVIRGLNIPVEVGAGLFAGALVNTAALDSVVNKVANDLPVAGYGVAYPFGVFGPIFCIFLAFRLLRPVIPHPPTQAIRVAELLVSQPHVIGKLLSEVTMRLPKEVQVVAVRQNGHNLLPRGNLRLAAGDEIMVEGDGEPLAKARRLIGEETPVDMFLDRHDLNDLSVYVSKPSVIGHRLGSLQLPEQLGCAIVAIQRGNSILYPQPGLILEAGDQLRIIAEPDRFEAIRAFFGNSAYSTAEVSYLSLGLGMVLGVLFGLIPFPLPGLGTFTFGAAGGALIVALILGWRGRIGQLSWTMPPSANLTLRNFGLTLFLAVVGMRSAKQFISTLQTSGLTLLLGGAAITLTIVVLATVLSYWVFKMPFDDVLGVVAGVTGNPAILAYASKAVPTNRPELGYANVFPTSTIVKIIVAQILLSRFLS